MKEKPLQISQPSTCLFSVNALSMGLSIKYLRKENLLKGTPEKLLSTDVTKHLRSVGLDAYLPTELF